MVEGNTEESLEGKLDHLVKGIFRGGYNWRKSNVVECEDGLYKYEIYVKRLGGLSERRVANLIYAPYSAERDKGRGGEGGIKVIPVRCRGTEIDILTRFLEMDYQILGREGE